MNIYQLEYFLQLAKYEHMTETADYLNISQSALSKSINMLESELGVQLFDRVGKRLKLNAAGIEYAKHVSNILEELNLASERVKDLRYEQTGRVSIACYAHYTILAEAIAEYQRLNPHVVFDFINTRSEQASMSDVDFILCSSGFEAPGQQTEQYWIPQTLFNEGFVVMSVPELLPEGCSDEIDLADLRDTPFLVMWFGGHVFLRDSTYMLCQKAGFTPKISVTCNDYLLRVRFAEYGLGVGIIPDCCIADSRSIAPSLQFLRIKGADIGRSVMLMRKRKGNMSETALDFWNYVMTYYSLNDDRE